MNKDTPHSCGCGGPAAPGQSSCITSKAAQSAVFHMSNMDCRNEEALVRRTLEGMPGVQRLEFDLPNRKLTVLHELDAPQTLEKSLQSVGMNARMLDAAPARTGKAPASAAAPTAGVRITYRIENMDCPTEEALIRDRLGKEPGVTALDFNLMQRVLGVQHTLPTTEPIDKALASIGMKAQRQDQQTMTTLLRIAKMDCPTEEGLIRAKLQGMPGVSGLDFNLMRRTLTLRHAPKAIGPAVEAIESLGMETEVQKTDEPRDPHVPASKTNWWPMAVSGIAAVAAEGIYWVNDGNHWAVIVLALVSIFTGGLSTYKKGWIALKNRNLNMNAHMSIAVTGGMAIGHWPEAAMVMFLFALAEVIEAKSLDRARNAIRGLMDLAPETATVRQTDGTWIEMPAKEVAKGTVVRVRPGERIALDGMITAGRSAINQAPITGESLPVEKPKATRCSPARSTKPVPSNTR